MDEVKYFSNIPLLRVFANAFDFKSKTKRKDFIIDFILLIVLGSLLSFIITLILSSLRKLTNSNVLVVNFNLAYAIVGIVLFIPLLSLIARRINDTGNSKFLLLIILLGPGIIILLIVCLFKSKSDYPDEQAFKNSNGKKILISVVGIVAIQILLGIGCIVLVISVLKKCSEPNVVSTSISDYSKYVIEVNAASEYMPELTSLGNYTNATFSYRYERVGYMRAYDMQSLSLFVTYNENDYTTAINNNNNSYDFIEQTYYKDYQPIFPVTNFDYKDYHFRLVYHEDETNNYISFMMIGYNEEKNKIAYLYINTDYDYLLKKDSDEELDEFITEFIKDYIWWNDK